MPRAEREIWFSLVVLGWMLSAVYLGLAARQDPSVSQPFSWRHLFSHRPPADCAWQKLLVEGLTVLLVTTIAVVHCLRG
jgi:hypothetical protein